MNFPGTQSSCRTLLVIASDKANMQLMVQLIGRRSDWKLLTAPNGNDGMRLANEAKPNVVILDTALSDIKALKVLGQLRGNPLTSHIPVVAVSSDAHRVEIESGLHAGFYRYIIKPYKLTDLLDAIDSALNYSMDNSEALHLEERGMV